MYLWGTTANDGDDYAVIYSRNGTSRLTFADHYSIVYNTGGSRGSLGSDEVIYNYAEMHFYETGTSNEVNMNGMLYCNDLDDKEGWAVTDASESSYHATTDTKLEIANDKYVTGTYDNSSADDSEFYVLFKSDTSNPLTMSYKSRCQASSLSDDNYTVTYNIRDTGDGTPSGVSTGTYKTFKAGHYIDTKDVASALFYGADFNEDQGGYYGMGGYAFSGWHSSTSTLSTAGLRPYSSSGLYTGTTSTQSNVTVYGTFYKPELEITKTADKTSYEYDSDITYTINVSQTETDTDYENNSMTLQAIGAQVTDTLPDELKLNSASSAKGGTVSTNGNSFTVSYGSGAGDAMSDTITVNATIVAEGTDDIKISNTATASSTKGYCDTVTSTSTVNVLAPVLEIEKSADKAIPDAYMYNDPDDPASCVVTYTLKVQQTKSGISAHNTVITDTIPNELELVSVTADNGTVAEINGNSFTLNYGDLAYGDTATITITANTVSYGEDIPNTAYANADHAKEVSDSANIRIIVPDIEIVKTADEYEYYVGDEVNYDIMVELADDSECEAKGFVISDTLPEGLEIVGTPTVTCQNNEKMATHATVTVSDDKKSFTVEWPVNSSYYLTSADVIYIHVTAACTEDVANNTVENVAMVTALNTPDEPEDEADVDVIEPELSITKMADKVNYAIGDEITYTITVTQDQPDVDAYNVIVSDDLPTYMELVSVSAANTSVNGTKGAVSRYGNNSFIVTYEKLSYGEEAVITVKAKALTNHDGIVNSATADADNTYEPVEDEATVNVLLPELAITKLATPSSYSQTDTVTYEIEVSQTVADLTAYDVVVSDTLPDELTLLNVESDGDVSIHNNSFTVTFGELSYGADELITVTASADEVGEEIWNTAYASGYADTAETTPVKDVQDDAKISIRRPGLNVLKDAEYGPYYPDDEVTYTLTVYNNAEADDGVPTAYNVVVSDELPDGMTLVDVVSVDGEVEINGNAFTVAFASVAPGESHDITVTATVEDSAANTTVTNIVTVTSDNADPVDDYVDIAVIKPVLEIEKTADKAIYSVDEDVTYTITAEQTVSGVTAENVVITDTLPEGMALKDIQMKEVSGTVYVDGEIYSAADAEADEADEAYADVDDTEAGIDDAEAEDAADDAAIADGGTEIRIEIPELRYGETAVIEVTVTATQAGEDITNTAYITADHADDEDDDADVTVLQPALSVTKTVDFFDHFESDEAVYTIVVSQTVEGAEAYDVFVYDALPEGLTLVDVSTLGPIGEVSIDGNTLIVSYGTLSYGNDAEITVTATVDPEYTDRVIDNVATAHASNVPDDPEDDAEVEFMDPALEITKVSDKAVYDVGDEVTYVITVTQTVEDEYETDVVVTDEIPTGLTVNHVKLEGVEGSVSQLDNDITVTIPKLSYGEEAVVTVRATVGESLAEQNVTNVAAAKGGHTDEATDDAVISVNEMPEETPAAAIGGSNGGSSGSAKTGISALPIALAAIAGLIAVLAIVFVVRRRRTA